MIFSFFIEPLKLFLSRKRTPCKVLDLGALETLTFHGLLFLKALNRANELVELTLASIKYDPSSYSMFCLDISLLQRCSSLQVLSLDYETLNNELVNALHSLPLKKLLICVHNRERNYPGISERTWSDFATHFPGIELIVYVVHALDIVKVLQVRILRRSMPITHVRVLFCEYVSEFCESVSITTTTTLFRLNNCLILINFIISVLFCSV